MISRKIFISVVYFKPAPLVKTGYLNPIQAGRALGRFHVEGAIGDDTGDNISERNISWNELTALYWMRRNVEAEYYGLMHYRRLMVFADKRPGSLGFSGVTEREYERYGWNDALIEKACESADILTPPVRDLYLPGLPEVLMTVSEFYAHQHFGRDMDILEAVVKERSPEIYPYFVDMLVGRKIFFNSISVMRRPFFEEYADWLIDILEEAERRADTTGYDSHQRRLCGFFSEYLTYAYVAYAKAARGAKVREMPVTWGMRARPAVSTEAVLAEARRRRMALPQTGAASARAKEDINVVIACDDNYAPHAAVAMLSALANAAEPARLRFLVLAGERLSEENRARLSDALARRKGRVEFVEIDESRLRWLPLRNSRLSIAAYYRIVMHDYLPGDVGKVIYVDADTIVTDDLATLWAIDLEGHPVAAAPDDAGFNQGRRLKLPREHRYFNSGVMVFDVGKMRAIDMSNAVLDIFRRNGPWIISEDQDILNILFCGNVRMLHLRWNAGTRIYRANPLEPSYDEEEALEAAGDPAIVHFTDKRKPWHLKCTHPFAALYWDYRNETQWAETAAAGAKRKLVFWLRARLRARDRRFERKVAGAVRARPS